MSPIGGSGVAIGSVPGGGGAASANDPVQAAVVTLNPW